MNKLTKRKANTELEPLIKTPYRYIGKGNHYWLQGNQYYPISIGYHYEREWGYGVWVTDEEGYTEDTDYCVFMSIAEFNQSFWKE